MSRMLFLALLLGTTAFAASPRTWTFSTATMGTIANLSIVAADSAEIADPAYRALLSIHQADSLLSNWSKTSEIARVNREAATGRVQIDPALARILQTADTVHNQSMRAFDPTIEPLVRAWGFLEGTPHVPDQAELQSALEFVGWPNVELEGDTLSFKAPEVRIDLGAIAKGYAVDEAARLLDDDGIDAFLVDLSGNMAIRGTPPGRDAWLIGIREPNDRVAHLGTLALSNATLSTSGDYEQFAAEDGRRYGHILDPRTGRPVEGMAQVTVIAQSAMLADAWSTALFVLGPDESRRVAAEHEELDCILILRANDGTMEMWIEEELRSAYEPHPATTSLVTIHWF